MKVSVLLLTYNEERNLPACLSSLTWCDDIVVIDSGSTDDSISIAREFGARVLVRPFDTFAGQRNWGLLHGDFRNEWILHLDADEIVTPEFVAALETFTPITGIDAFHVPSKLILFGRWLRHAGMYPTYQVRLGHRDRLRFVQIGHGQREDLPADRVGVFDTPYLHYSFSQGLLSWLNKHVVYAHAESEVILAQERLKLSKMDVGTKVSRRRAMKRVVDRLPVMFRPFLRFAYVYFLCQGFRDGRAGLAYAFMLAVYEGMIAVFVLESRQGQRESRLSR